MLLRLALLGITAFWIVMNALLWRVEFRGAVELGSPIPVQSVLEKLLTAPDDSSLAIFRDGKRIGFCLWSINVGEEFAAGKVGSEDLPEGQIKRLSGYTLDLDGNLLLDTEGTRLRFTMHSEFTTNHHWETLHLRMVVRPVVWQLTAHAAQQRLQLRMQNGEVNWEREFKFADFQNPQVLLREFGLPGWGTGLVTPGANWPALPRRAPWLKWSARHDWLKIGRSHVRVYRLEAKPLDRYPVVIQVSRMGEILRAELPNRIVLRNERLAF